MVTVCAASEPGSERRPAETRARRPGRDRIGMLRFRGTGRRGPTAGASSDTPRDSPCPTPLSRYVSRDGRGFRFPEGASTREARRGGAGYGFWNTATNSFKSRGLLLLMAPVRKSLTDGTCLPFQTSRNISSEALKKQSASFSGLPFLTSHLSLPTRTVHFSSSPSEK